MDFGNDEAPQFEEEDEETARRFEAVYNEGVLAARKTTTKEDDHLSNPETIEELARRFS